MKWEFVKGENEANNASQLVGLDNLKAELRKKDSLEDTKLALLLAGALTLFQNQTGFYFQQGTFDLRISDIDFPPASDSPRSSQSRNDLNYYNEQARDHRPLIFNAKMSAKLKSQRPTSFSWVRRDSQETISLTPEEVATLPDDFFHVVDNRPLSFYLKTRDVEVLTSKEFDYYSAFSISLGLSSIGENPQQVPPLPDDVKLALVKIASFLFESADVASKIENEWLIQQAYIYYSCGRGV